MLELQVGDREALDRIAAEVLRWNASINLISRKDAEGRLESLRAECDAAFAALHAWWERNPAGPRPLRYIDLGSGGGFPGLAWHVWLAGIGLPGNDFTGSTLVEPREKRAWFLEHAALKGGLRGCAVARRRWDARMEPLESPADEAARQPRHDLVSLKALDLGDDAILAGWRRAGGDPGRDALTIVRFRTGNPLDIHTNAPYIRDDAPAHLAIRRILPA